MIIEVTISGTVHYIDTEIILYAYNDSGLKLIVATGGVTYSPSAEIFEANSIQTISLPTYANFVIFTANAGFLEVSHATWGTICVNLLRINRLVVIDGSNTTIFFDKYNYVNVDVAIATLEAAINAALSTADYYQVTEQSTSDGTGNITTTNDYLTGSLRVYIDGSLTAPSRITATGAGTYSIATPPDTGSTIVTRYLTATSGLLIEQVTSDGTGTVATSQSYEVGSLRSYSDGSLVSPSRITATGGSSYSIATPPDTGSVIVTIYKPTSVTGVQTTLDEATADGTGVVTTTGPYASGTLNAYVDGSLTAPSRVTELTATTYSLLPVPDVGSKILTEFQT